MLLYLLYCLWVAYIMTVSDDQGYAQQFKEGFSTDLFSGFHKIRDDGVLRCSTALDPRFKTLKCIAKSKRQAVWNLLHNLMKEVDTDTCEKPATKISQKGSHANMLNFGSHSKEECSDNRKYFSTVNFPVSQKLKRNF